MKNVSINQRNAHRVSVNEARGMLNGLNDKMIDHGMLMSAYKEHYPALSEIRDRQAVQALIQTFIKQ